MSKLAGKLQLYRWKMIEGVIISCYTTSLDKIPDKLLWDAFKEGNEMTFVHIYQTYSMLLFECGCKYASDKEMVRDCLHDFFLYLKKNRPGSSENTSIRLYLFKAFRRRIVDYLKKNNYQLSLSEPSHYSPYKWNLLSKQFISINRFTPGNWKN